MLLENINEVKLKLHTALLNVSLNVVNLTKNLKLD